MTTVSYQIMKMMKSLPGIEILLHTTEQCGLRIHCRICPPNSDENSSLITGDWIMPMVELESAVDEDRYLIMNLQHLEQRLLRALAEKKNDQ